MFDVDAGEKHMELDFFRGKKVLVTGHTGFKGSWMCQILSMSGAVLSGYALEPPERQNLFDLCGLSGRMDSVMGDIRDFDKLKKVFEKVQPEIVIHMAAQPIVRESYKNPVYTYEINVMGTVNVLECVRLTPSVQSVVNVTTDKVYRNREWEWGYRENEELCGFDPYSNSKSCSELITSCYNNSFFENRQVAVSTVRAGNVIGGGDFAVDRIIPDCIRAAEKDGEIIVRNPWSVRPYQHVLEPVMAYLMIAKTQFQEKKYAGCYNIGPNREDCLATGALVDLFCKKWNLRMEQKVHWKNQSDEGPHEAGHLALDCSKIRTVFGWKPRWNIENAIDKIIEWEENYLMHKKIEECMNSQICGFLDTI